MPKICYLFVVVCALHSTAHAGVIEFYEKAEWEAAVGPFTTIDFTGFPVDTFITEQYADDGVLFPGNTQVIRQSDNLFPNDGWGLGSFEKLRLEFAEPIMWLAVDFPGLITIDLYRDGELVYESLAFGGGGAGFFAGLILEEGFDAAILDDPRIAAGPDIDDLFFGPPIVPGAGAVGLLGIAAIGGRRRRLAD